MELTVRLLGEVNRGVDAKSSVRPRYLAAITAAQLSTALHFDRTGERKSDRFKIRPDSFIQIDDEIQRGKDGAGNLLQLPAKVEDIANTLLGVDKGKGVAPRAFLGTLIWNVRPSQGNSIVVVGETVFNPGAPSGPPQFKLRLTADHVYLTDSAHRHLGIVQAFRKYQSAPGLYSRFSPDLEFVVELYQLDRAEEKALFYELNAMQKRITAAKRKEMDTVSSAGFVKDVVREHDSAHKNLFQDNIEVTSNQNIYHTLMTMSAFVSSIHEMFPKPELDEAKTNAVKRAELAEYYCNFFYRLNESVTVQISDGAGGSIWVHPYGNLYSEFIQPVLNEDESSDVDEGNGALEEKLETARKRAKDRNALVRSQDLANNNVTIKALCRIGRLVRPMAKWEAVIDYLQTKLNSPDGQFFQKTNKELMDPQLQLAKLNDDGSINLQVQSHTLASMVRFLRRKLLLDLPAEFRVVPADAELAAIEVGPSVPSIPAKRTGSVINFEVAYYLAGDEPPEDPCKVGVRVDGEGFEWKSVTLTGAKRLLPVQTRKDESYSHPVYGADVSRYVSEYTMETGKAPNAASEVPLVFVFAGLDLDGQSKLDSEFRLKIVLT